MQAVSFQHVGEAEDVLSVGDAPAPVPGTGEVLVRVSARPIHPADFLFIRGVYRVAPRLPQVAGLEGAGVVVAVGTGVDARWVGRRVAFRHPGAWAELAVAPLTRVYPVPDGIDDSVACQFSLNPLTAWALMQRAALPAGTRALVTAGRSVVARLLAALAERRGVHATLIERRNTDYLASQPLGTPMTAGTLAGLLEQLVRHGRYHAILDAVGGPETLELIAAAEPGAHLISYGLLDDRPFSLRAATLLYRNLVWEGFGVDRFLDRLSPEELARACDELWLLLAENSSALPVIARHPLSAVQAALSDVRGATTSGKVLLIGPEHSRESLTGRTERAAIGRDG